MFTKFSFQVRRNEPELILPAKKTPREIKQVSVVDDMDFFRIHIPVILFYRNVINQFMEGNDPVKLLRSALGKVLQYYYPLAGRLFRGDNNKLILDCNEEGVLFIEADADITLEQLGGDAMQWPCPYMEELLHDVPGAGGIVGCPLLLIQVTRLMCGGVVLALRINHVLSDAIGLLQFLHGFADIARGNSEPSILPVWKRELLNAQTKPQIKITHPEYTGMADNHDVLSLKSTDLVSRCFFFGPEEIRCIRKHCPKTQSFSKFEMITACVWKSHTIVHKKEPNQVAVLTHTISICGKDLLNLPNGYYGNTTITTAVVSNVGELCNNPLGYALGAVKKAKSRVNKDYLQSLVDLLVKGRPEFTSSNFIVADTSKIRFQDVDFGWGIAVCGGPSIEPTTSFSAYMRCRNSNGEDGIVVPIRLPVDKMERFSVEIGKMTRELGEDTHNIGPKNISSRL